MSWWDTLKGMVGLGGGVVSAVDDAAKLGQQVTAEVHDKNQRDQGAVAQQETTDAATLKTINDASAPVSTSDSERLWDRNKARFGPSDKAGG